MAATITAVAVIANVAQWKQAPSINLANVFTASTFKKRVEFNDIRTLYDMLHFVSQEGWSLTAMKWFGSNGGPIGNIVNLPPEPELARIMAENFFNQIKNACSQAPPVRNLNMLDTKIIEDQSADTNLCSLKDDLLQASLTRKYTKVLSSQAYNVGQNPKTLLMDGLPASLFSSAEVGRQYALNFTLTAKTDGLVYLTSQ